jgi:chemotaxis family two-component system response regulator Rcp1
VSTSIAAPERLNDFIGRPIRILLVEDSPSDVAMTKAALRDGRIANDLSVVGDGEAAMAYLHHEGEYSQAVRPDLVLLDLNLPKKDGREVLAEVKEDLDLKAIPIIVLTTSAAESDILRSYELHANSYVTKPVGLDAFLESIRGIENFWLTLVRLPDRHDRIA